MAALQTTDAAQLYNRQALGYLCALLFHPDSLVALALRGRWARYSPDATGTLQANVVTLLRAIFEAEARLEITDAHLQVLDSPALRIPATLLADSRAYPQIVRGLAHFFRRTVVVQPTMVCTYTDYQFNHELDAALDRGTIARALVQHVLATTPDAAYRATRDAFHAAATALYYEYYNRCATPHATRGVAVAAPALERIAAMTAPHSPVLRGAPPDLLRLRLSGSDDAHHDGARSPHSVPSIFYVACDREALSSSDQYK